MGPPLIWSRNGNTSLLLDELLLLLVDGDEQRGRVEGRRGDRVEALPPAPLPPAVFVCSRCGSEFTTITLIPQFLYSIFAKLQKD